jgi:hypothetical protein
VSTACSAFMGMAVVPSLSLMTWRCGGCRRIVVRLEYDGRSLIEHRCTCNTWNRLPDDQHNLRMEQRR